MTDTMGRMHSDAQFAGSSSVKFLFLLCARQNKQVSFALAYESVPAHVEMMGFLGIGNNPMVGAPKRQGCATSCAIAVDISAALSK